MHSAHILVRHYVPGDHRSVFASFTRELFERLSPKFPPAKLLRYDGNAVGDEVHIWLGVGPLGQRWVSEITDHHVGESSAYFVDEGRELPFPLTNWRHRHLIEQAGPGRVAIVEDITFATPTAWLTRVMRPVIKAQFAARGDAYTDFFGSGQT